jgi:ferredoxin
LRIIEDCISCGMCVEECPFEAIQIDHLNIIKKGYSQSTIDQTKCKNCKTCIINFECPANAIKEN